MWMDGRKGSRVERRIKMRFSRLVEFNVTPATPSTHTHTSLTLIVYRPLAHRPLTPSPYGLQRYRANDNNDSKRSHASPVASRRQNECCRTLKATRGDDRLPTLSDSEPQTLCNNDKRSFIRKQMPFPCFSALD